MGGRVPTSYFPDCLGLLAEREPLEESGHQIGEQERIHDDEAHKPKSQRAKEAPEQSAGRRRTAEEQASCDALARHLAGERETEQTGACQKRSASENVVENG